jgi:DNA-directed RNA polymerase specialized sigma24 family protein
LRVVPPANALRPDGRGIDLAKRGDEVRKLFYAAFARGLVRDGFDPEEALQEVYKGLLSRNRGSCPFDVSKSSFGHYVHIVARCVLANFVRKEKQRTLHETSCETVGSSQGSSRGSGDSEYRSSAWEGVSPANQEDNARALDHLIERVSEHLPEGHDPTGLALALDYMAQGHTKKEAAQRAGADYKLLVLVVDQLKRSRGRVTPVSPVIPST